MIPQTFIPIDKIVSVATDRASGQKSAISPKDLFSTMLASITNRSSVTRLPGDAILSSSDVKTDNRAGLLELVKKYALSKSGNLDTLYIDEAALKDFETFLLGAGFDPESVTALMDKLKARMGGRDLKVSELFQELKDLKIPSEDRDEKDILEISALPFIEAALSSVGIRQSEVMDIISKATIEGKGIDLDQLVNSLKALKNNPIDGGGLKWTTDSLNLAGNRTAGRADNTAGIADIMTRLGIKSVAGQEKGKTLDDFIAGLESLMVKKGSADEVASLLNTDLKRFFEKVKVDTEPLSEAKSVGLKEKYLTQGTDKKGAASEKYSFLNGKRAETSPTETLPETKALAENPGFEKSGIEGKLAAKSSENGPLASSIPKGGGKSAERASSRTTKTEGVVTYEGIVTDSTRSDASSGASEAKPVPRSLPMYVVDQVGRQIIRSVNNGENEIRLQIRPPSLGRLHMTIDTTSDGIRISILAENRTTKDLILANSSELKVAIQSQGIQINEIDVQVSSDFQQAMQDMREKERHGKGNNREKTDDGNPSGRTEVVNSVLPVDVSGHMSGRLDLVA